MFESREYKIFREEEFNERNRFSIYEKLAKTLGSKLKIKVKPDKKIQSAIDFTGLKVTQSDITSLTLVTFIITFLASLIIALTGFFTTTFSFFLIALSLGVTAQIYYYPVLYMKSMKLKASSEIVLMTLYITVSTRHVPNLEHAVKFAAENLQGVLSHQLKKLIWDIETRRFINIEDALKNYVDNVWSHDYPEVKESFELIISSVSVSNRRRETMLTEAIEVILQGSKERARHYSQELRTPVTIINTMGILLPVIGLVLLPIITIFLTDTISPISIILIYNIMLPSILVISIYYILQKRPWTFSLPDISNYPGIAQKGKFNLYGINIPSIIPAIIVTLSLLIIPIYLMPSLEVYTTGRLFTSILFTYALAFGIGTYMYLNTFQKTDIRDEITRLEQSFSEALFTLGSKMGDGAPIEYAIERTIKSLGNSPLVEFFKITLRNIKQFGMTFEQAVFNKEHGAINYYPSPLMRSIFTIITRTSQKGSSAAAKTMLVISEYLKGIHDTEEEMKSILSETTSSLEFQAWGLAPITTGIVVSLAAAVQKILKELDVAFQGLNNYFEQGASVGEESLQPFIQLDKVMSPDIFQLVVGLYLIEVVLIISYFFIILTKGDEWISKENYTGKMLIISTIIYSIVLIILYTVFNAIIPGIVSVA